MPDPGTMAGYGDVDESFPERIMLMAEVNVHGRNEILRSAMRTENFNAILGSMVMALVTVGGLAASIWALATGRDAAWLLAALPALIVAVGRGVASVRGDRSDADGSNGQLR